MRKCCLSFRCILVCVLFVSVVCVCRSERCGSERYGGRFSDNDKETGSLQCMFCLGHRMIIARPGTGHRQRNNTNQYILPVWVNKLLIVEERRKVLLLLLLLKEKMFNSFVLCVKLYCFLDESPLSIHLYVSSGRGRYGRPTDLCLYISLFLRHYTVWLFVIFYVSCFNAEQPIWLFFQSLQNLYIWCLWLALKQTFVGMIFNFLEFYIMCIFFISSITLFFLHMNCYHDYVHNGVKQSI